MTLDTSKAVPLFTSIAAHLYVRDLEVSLAFFTGKLGFAIDFVYGEPSFYAQVSRDNARLALRSMDEPVFVAGVREREELLSASITLAGVGEIERIFAAFEAVSVLFHQVIRQEPWGAETFVVADPDGNLISFAGPAA